jgi:hypothetical protein
MSKMLESTPVNECFAVTCDKCGKTTWRGCGNHVDSVSLVSCTPEFILTTPRLCQGSKRRIDACVLGRSSTRYYVFVP